MSKGKSKKVRKVDTLVATDQLITKLLGDTRLYMRLPAFVPLFDKVLRTRDKLERIVTNRLQDVDHAVRENLGELIAEFKSIVREQTAAGVSLVALKRLLRERHNIDATSLVILCPGPGTLSQTILI